jgi:serine/threonine protein kinase
MKIPGYKIFKKIGEGAMASVFLAEQESLGRKVALKVLSPILAGQQGFTERFLKEGRIIAYLNHPQIVSVYDLGSHEHHYYLAMEFLAGGTLEQKIRMGMSPAQSVQFLKQISEPLGVAHDHGVIHRDIKPQNILFRDNQTPVLTDFGIARLMESDPQLTIPGRAIGSPHYMSPEQINGDRIDARADLYSVGILFYKMLTSRLPYQADQFLAIALMHKTEPLPILPEEHASFQPILNRLLAKNPDDRFSSAQELIQALSQIESDNSWTADEENQNNRMAKKPVKNRIADLANGIAESSPSNDIKTPPTAVDATSVGLESENKTVNTKENKTIQPSKQPKELKRRLVTQYKIFFRWKALGLSIAVVVIIVGGMHFLSPSSDTPRKKLSSSKHSFNIENHKVPAASSAKALQGESILPHVISKDDSTIGEKPTDVSPVNKGSGSKVAVNKQSVDEEPVNELSLVNKNPPNQNFIDEKLGNEQKIEQLITKSEKQLKIYHLTAPEGDNCYETYQQILVLDTSGKEARKLLMQIGQAYRRLAMAEKKRGRLKIGMEYVDKGLKLLPEDFSLVALKSEIQNELAEQVRMLEQAKQIAHQKRIEAEERKSIEEKIKREKEYQAQLQQKKEIPFAIQKPTILESDQDKILNKNQDDQEKHQAPKIEVESEENNFKKKQTERKNRLFGTF